MRAAWALSQRGEPGRVGRVVPQFPGRGVVAAAGRPPPGQPEVTGGHRLVVVEADDVERALVRTLVDGLHRPVGQTVHQPSGAGGTGPRGAGSGRTGLEEPGPGAGAPPAGPVGRHRRAEPTEQAFDPAHRRERAVVLATALGEPLVDLVLFDPHAAGEQQVDEQPVVLVDAHARVVGGDDGVGPGPMDDLVAGHVRGEQVVLGDGHVPESQPAPRREHPERPGPDGQDVDLVDGDPVTHHGGQRLDGQFRPGPVAVGGVGPQPEVLAQPCRMGEVVQGDERLEAAVEAAPGRWPRSAPGRPRPRRRGQGRPGPTRRSAGSCCSPGRRHGRGPPRAGPRSRRRSPDGSTRPTCSQASQLLAG